MTLYVQVGSWSFTILRRSHTLQRFSFAFSAIYCTCLKFARNMTLNYRHRVDWVREDTPLLFAAKIPDVAGV
jgi:hypothetical protein